MLSILIRLVFAVVLVAATFNPTGVSYVHWAERAWESEMPLVVLAGLVLLVGYIVYVRATLRSIGVVGVALILAIFAALVWVAIDYGLLTLGDRALTEWLLIAAMSLVLGIGLSWSIIRRRLSGQADVDDVDE